MSFALATQPWQPVLKSTVMSRTFGVQVKRGSITMPAYHCTIDESSCQVACRSALLPIKTQVRGNAPPADPAVDDIVDLALFVFKANSLQKNFEFQNQGDRTLVYAILFISQCLAKVHQSKPSSKAEAKKQLYTLAVSDFAKPGEPGFPISSFYEAPKSKDEGEMWRVYMRQLREEITIRLVDKIFIEDEPNKFWVAQFAKRKFMGKSL